MKIKFISHDDVPVPSLEDVTQEQIEKLQMAGCEIINADLSKYSSPPIVYTKVYDEEEMLDRVGEENANKFHEGFSNQSFLDYVIANKKDYEPLLIDENELLNTLITIGDISAEAVNKLKNIENNESTPGHLLHKKRSLSFSTANEPYRNLDDLYKNIKEYYDFVLMQAQELGKLHGENGSEYIKELGSFWEDQNDVRIEDLCEKTKKISEVADKIIVEYQHKKLPQANNIVNKNNTLLNRVIDSFKRLLQSIKSMFKSTSGVKFTQELSAEKKQEILRSLEELQTKNKQKPTLS